MSDQSSIKTKPRTLIHIGVGAGKRLSEYQSLEPAKIVLVEAGRSSVARLSQKASAEPNVHVFHAVIGTEVGETDLFTWNFARLNSIQKPTPVLHELFPGLVLKERQTVPVITPSRLLSEIGDVARPLSVIVEAPGSEMIFLTACKADGVLEQIDQLEILAAEEMLFQGSVTRAELEKWLLGESFVITARDDADADWTVLHLEADHNARALAKAEARIDALSKTVISVEATLSDTQAALEAAKERAEGLEESLTETRAATEAKAKALAERDAALKAAIDKVSGLEATVADLGKQQQTAEQKRDDAISTLDFQTRLQAMLQVDLENLRGRLEQSETQRQRQEELLGKLTAKLSLAAEYLRNLPPSAQDGIAAAAAPELSSPRRRSAGKKQKTKAVQGPGK